MEAAKNLFCSSPFPSRTNHWSGPPSSSSSSSLVFTFHEQATPAVTSRTAIFASQHFPTSVLLQEQRHEYRPILRTHKEEKTSQATLDTRQMDMVSVHEDNSPGNADQLVHDFKQRLQIWPCLRNLLTSLPAEEIATSSTPQPVTSDLEHPAEVEQHDAVALAKQALSASKQAALVAADMKSIKADDDVLPPLGFSSTSLDEISLGKNKIVRSTRLLGRQSKKRKKSKAKVLDEESYLSKKAELKGRLHVEKKINEGFDQNDPLRLFLWGPETKQLLTLEEETKLVLQLQDLLRLEGVKKRLQSQFGREPTLAEWADSVGLTCQALQFQLYSGNRSREKLIYANLRMVVHIAKHYQGRGLSFQDLLQEGSMGLMKSVEKFKPQAGCRFGTYAYWWIRQTIRKAIFQHSRTIRLPENVYTLLGKVSETKKLYIREGNLHPTKEELAKRVGITVEKLEKLLYVARIPISMQQTVWADQDTTFQEVTADTAIEVPDVSVAKQMMRRHVRNLLSILNPKERRIIRLRFGIEDGEQKSLSEIGNTFGLSKERVRQLESRALYKLKQCLGSQGLDAYAELLV